jgi:hypothetical protein
LTVVGEGRGHSGGDRVVTIEPIELVLEMEGWL